jgi:hypothetical protein
LSIADIRHCYAWSAVVSVVNFLALFAPIFGSSTSSQAQIAFEIGEVSGQAGQTIEVPVTIQSNAVPASTAALFLQFDAEKLSVTGVAAGEALPSGKEVQNNASAGKVGLIAFGLGEAPLDDGVLFVVSFDTAEASNGDTLSVQGAQASAAGIDAAALGVSVADGAIVLGCPGVGLPSGIQATDDDPDGVSISWVAVAGAVEYRVYRSSTGVVAEAEPIGAWSAETTLFDDTMPPSSGGGLACSGEAGDTFYYWVAARTSTDCESGLGGPSAGSRADKRVLAAYAHGRLDGAGLATLALPSRSSRGDLLVLSTLLFIFALCKRCDNGQFVFPFFR